MENEKILFGAVLAIGLLMLGWVAYATLSSGSTSAAQVNLQQKAVPSECGDINDAKNIQHLSHHPDRYKECYEFIDPQKFKAAVGKDISSYLN